MGSETEPNAAEVSPETKERLDALASDANEIRGELADAESMDDLLIRMSAMYGRSRAENMNGNKVLSMDPEKVAESKMVDFDQAMVAIKDVVEFPDRYDLDSVADIVPEYIRDRMSQLMSESSEVA